jgi:hypothetical protein
MGNLAMHTDQHDAACYGTDQQEHSEFEACVAAFGTWQICFCAQ